MLYNTLLKRRREVATAVARAMDRNRALAINKEGPQTYFDDLEHCISHNKILPKDMWNFDENAVSNGAGRKEK